MKAVGKEVGVREGAQGSFARSRVPIATGNEGKTTKKTKTRFSVAWFTQLLLADLGVVQCNLMYLGVVHACVVGFDSGCLGLARGWGGSLGQSTRKDVCCYARYQLYLCWYLRKGACNRLI